MNKRIKITPRFLWFAVSFVLLTLPVFLPSSQSVDSTMNLCLILMILLSFPFCIPAGWLFMMSSLFDGSINSLYLMLIVCSTLGYLQWFVFVPRFARFVRILLGGKDLQIKINANVEGVRQLSEMNIGFATQNWQKEWYDEQQRTPVERVFDGDD